MIRVCVAGATGWVGRQLTPAILASSDLTLVGAVSRTFSGKTLSKALNLPGQHLRLSPTVRQALKAKTDVLVDYTSPNVVRSNVLFAVNEHVNVVVGTSGMSDEDYNEIDVAAKKNGVGVVAAGNFAISGALMLHFALLAAKFMPSWEVIDYASANKIDAPSGTARELVYRLSTVHSPKKDDTIKKTQGIVESRGAKLDGTQVHSVRLPGYVIGVETLFGKSGEQLSIRFEGGAGPEPYIEGTLLAIRRVVGSIGLTRGLDCLMQF